MIRNIGRRTACNVQGFISFERIQPRDLMPEADVVLGRDLGFDPVKFGINGQETVYLKGGAIRHPERAQCQIPSSPGWQALLICLRPQHYRIRIRVVARGAHPVTCDFDLSWNGHEIQLQPAAQA
jgi:hypothetical protein